MFFYCFSDYTVHLMNREMSDELFEVTKQNPEPVLLKVMAERQLESTDKLLKVFMTVGIHKII